LIQSRVRGVLVLEPAVGVGDLYAVESLGDNMHLGRGTAGETVTTCCGLGCVAQAASTRTTKVILTGRIDEIPFRACNLQQFTAITESAAPEAG